MITKTRASSSYRGRIKHIIKPIDHTVNRIYVIACNAVCNYGYQVVGVNGLTEQSDDWHISILGYRGDKFHQLGVPVGKGVATQ